MQTELVTVVVPTYNELSNLEPLVSAITALGHRLLIVDDASPDGTGDLADRLAAENPLLTVCHRTSKEGLGPAYAEGFARAIDGGAACVVQMDADFSHDPAAIPSLVAAVDAGADLAIGSRYVPGGSVPDWPLVRRLISRGGNIYAGVMLGISVRDATAGFRAWRASALAGLPFESAQASGYGFQVEMAWRSEQAGLDIVEVPIVFRDRVRGNSKMGGAIVVEAMRLVTRWGVERVFSRR